MNKHIIANIATAFFVLSLGAAPVETVARHTFALPSYVNGVKRPIIPLSGEWDFKYSEKSPWTKLHVPGEVAMQGYAIEHDKPFWMKKTVSVPADFAGRRIILRFDGVYSHARLSVNGHFIREHHGGFTRWETDVTPWIRAGKKNEIMLEITDRIDDISYASGYAHHPVGGILRDVTLFALPEAALCDTHVETLMDSLYENARLRFSCEYMGKEQGSLHLQLKDRQGRTVDLPKADFTLKRGSNSFSIPVENPVKWDAEHPYLYTLETTVTQGGKEVSRDSRHVGFREVKVDGNRLLVNGRQVKLRGACRHDLSFAMGRSTTADIDSLDAVLFKEANMNFVRTSHYPPTERFLDFCDRYGIYVESETAVCFVDTYRQKNYAPGRSENDSAFTGRYLGQLQEMVNSFRSHPSILFWSIGNESNYGQNFQKSWDWVKATDTTRPAIFSYPGSAEANKARIFDILSMHYQDVNGNLTQWGMTSRNFQGHNLPTLFDEWAHPACYTYETLQNDPGIREFWGQSIDKMWQGLFDAPGGLGGAIWGYVDDIFFLPKPKAGTSYWKEFAHTAKPAGFQGDCVGYGEWGIVDVWRRKKPEFWATKKAYSPVRLTAKRNISCTGGQRITLPVHNRFDHTNLKEIKATCTYQGHCKDISMPDVAPHEKGFLTLPAENWKEGNDVLVSFTDAGGTVIDTYRFTIGEKKIDYPALIAGKGLTVSDTDDQLVVRGNGFEVPFDKKTGLIRNAKVNKEVIIEQGPFPNFYVNLNHLTGAEVRKMANRYVTSDKNWKLDSFKYEKQGENVLVSVSGTSDRVHIDYLIKVGANGELSIDYQTQGLPNGYLRETGLAFYIPRTFKQLQWKRQGYWNYYPEGDFAGNEGSTPLFASKQAKYGQVPSQPWQADTHDYYYWADAGANCKEPLTQTAKGMKENINFYTLATNGKHQLSVVSTDASVACRMNKRSDEQLVLYTNNQWDYPEIAWGNYCKTIEALPCYGQINLRFK